MAEKPSLLSLISEIKDLYQGALEKEFEQFGLKGLVASHAAILACLYKNRGRVNMTQLSDHIGKTKSTVTELVARLVRLGYVKKTGLSGDKRVVEVVLTPQGLELKPCFYAISGRLSKRLYRGISAEQQRLASEILNQMKINLDLNGFEHEEQTPAPNEAGDH